MNVDNSPENVDNFTDSSIPRIVKVANFEHLQSNFEHLESIT